MTNKQMTKGGLSREAGFSETLSMGNIPGFDRALVHSVVSAFERAGTVAFGVFEVTMKIIGFVLASIIIFPLILKDWLMGYD